MNDDLKKASLFSFFIIFMASIACLGMNIISYSEMRPVMLVFYGLLSIVTGTLFLFEYFSFRNSKQNGKKEKKDE